MSSYKEDSDPENNATEELQTAISKTSAGLISNANELVALGKGKDKFMKAVIEKNAKATLEATAILARANSFTNDIHREFMTATFFATMKNCCQTRG